MNGLTSTKRQTLVKLRNRYSGRTRSKAGQLPLSWWLGLVVCWFGSLMVWWSGGVVVQGWFPIYPLQELVQMPKLPIQTNSTSLMVPEEDRPKIAQRLATPSDRQKLTSLCLTRSTNIIPTICSTHEVWSSFWPSSTFECHMTSTTHEATLFQVVAQGSHREAKRTPVPRLGFPRFGRSPRPCSSRAGEEEDQHEPWSRTEENHPKGGGTQTRSLPRKKTSGGFFLVCLLCLLLGGLSK